MTPPQFFGLNLNLDEYLDTKVVTSAELTQLETGWRLIAAFHESVPVYLSHEAIDPHASYSGAPHLNLSRDQMGYEARFLVGKKDESVYEELRNGATLARQRRDEAEAEKEEAVKAAEEARQESRHVRMRVDNLAEERDKLRETRANLERGVADLTEKLEAVKAAIGTKAFDEIFPKDTPES